jgi:hypothetical protein
MKLISQIHCFSFRSGDGVFHLLRDISEYICPFFHKKLPLSFNLSMNGFASFFQAHIEDSVTAVAGLHGSILAITFVPFEHYSSQVSHSKFSLPSAMVYQHVITPHLSEKKNHACALFRES